MPTILFICTANICRSPVAEALFAAWLRTQALGGNWRAESAGTWAEPGLPASTYSQEVLGALGFDISSHRSRRVDRPMIEAADLVLCMTHSHREALQAEFPDLAGRIQLLSAMAGLPHDIADPYGGPRQGYVAMAADMRLLIEAGGRQILELASGGATLPPGAGPHPDRKKDKP